MLCDDGACIRAAWQTVLLAKSTLNAKEHPADNKSLFF